MKSRFTTLDVLAAVTGLREEIVGLRVQNFYDVNSKTFMLKFTKPGTKVMVVIESGVRIHSTEQSLEKSVIPSQFNMKLRKHLASRRLTAIRQLGFDRVIDMEFAVGEGPEAEGTYHLISEFYSSGNIILTNHKYEVLSLLRVVRISESYFLQVGHVYDISMVSTLNKISESELIDKLANAGPKDTLKSVVASFPSYGASIAEHIVLEASLNPNLKVSSGFDRSSDLTELTSLMKAIDIVYEQIQQLKISQKPGYFILKLANPDSQAENATGIELADEYSPLLFNQLKKKSGIVIKETESFLKAVDTFYGNVGSVRSKTKANQSEINIQKKLDAMKQDQKAKIEALDNQQKLFAQKAGLISENSEYVEQVLLLIRSILAAEIDWDELSELVAQQRESGHPVAKHISGLKLEHNMVTLELHDIDSKQDSGTNVDIDLTLTPLANSQEYYNKQKQTVSKLNRTKAAEDLAFKRATKKILSKKNKKSQNFAMGSIIKKARKPMWFEAFIWFISTDGYLVIAGRDMQQNELIVRRYLKKNNIYVHADTRGATSVVIINHTNSPIVPVSTLIQAGDLAICYSKAWDAKIITSAYWVNADQVSKKAMTGEYLTTGSFVIRGKKNFLPPTSLTYGFGVLFKIEDSAVGNDETAGFEDSDQEGQNFTSVNAEIDDDYQKLREKYNLDLVDELGEIENSKLPSFLEPKSVATPETTQPSQNIVEELGDKIAQVQLEEKNKKHLSGKQKRDKKKGKGLTAANTVGSELPANDRVFSATGDQDKITTASEGSRNVGSEKPGSKKAADKKKQPSQETKQPGRRQKAGGKGKKNKSDIFDEEDEREREIRDALLKGSQKDKKDKKNKKGNEKFSKGANQSKSLDSNAAAGNSQNDPQRAGSRQKRQVVEVDPTELEFEINDNYKAVTNETMQLLSGLVSNPNPRSVKHVLRYAIPVCAPYGALSNYKYKVKLTPGELKKGKSTKMAKNLFVFAANKQLELETKTARPKKNHNVEKASEPIKSGTVSKPEPSQGNKNIVEGKNQVQVQDQNKNKNGDQGHDGDQDKEEMRQTEAANMQVEQRLLKSMGDNEMIAVMLGNVKISAPNLQAVQKSIKSTKTKAKAKKSQKSQ